MCAVEETTTLMCNDFCIRTSSANTLMSILQNTTHQYISYT